MPKNLLILFFLSFAVPLSAETLFQQANSDTISRAELTVTDTLAVSDSLWKADTSAVKDTLTFDDGKPEAPPPDTVRVLYQQPLYESSTQIENSAYIRSDYRYAADILKAAPFSFVRNTGFIGHPSEFRLYGAGYNDIMFTTDGLTLNNRINNTYNTWFIETEDIEAFEILPAVRAFLHGLTNNAAAVNLVTKDNIYPVPLTRIRYYEGPSDEVFFNARFSTLLFSKAALTVDVGNRKVESSFDNSEFGLWQAHVRFKYIFNNDYNLLAEYSLNDYNTGLNGGVNELSSINLNPDPTNTDEEILYDETLAIVNNNDRKQITVRHGGALRLLAQPSDYYRAKLSLYWQSYGNEFQQNTDLEAGNELRIDIDRSYVLFGGQALMEFDTKAFGLRVTGTGERVNYTYEDSTQWSENLFSLTAEATSHLFGKAFVPSVFAKAAVMYGEVLTGIGGDLSMDIGGGFSFYGGVSSYQAVDMVFPDKSQSRVSQLEAAIGVAPGSLRAEARAFYRHTEKQSLDEYTVLTNINGKGSLSQVVGPVQDVYGASLTLQYIWKPVYVSSTTSLVHSKLQGSDQHTQPLVVQRFAVFYRDSLLSGALDLKAGFTLDAFTEYSRVRYDYFNNRVYYTPAEGDVSANYQLDFVVSGEIQGAAILYFTWENLLDNKYYKSYLYPMPARGIRFGVAWELFN